MLLQIRVTVPPALTAQVRDLFLDDPGTAHLAVLPGASVSPEGDVVLADVARESADDLISALRALHVDRDGAICLDAVDAAISRGAEAAEKAAPGAGSDAVVWEQMVRTTDSESSLSFSYLAFLTIALLLAAIAIVNDSAILTIGAMVLGPEFAPLAALAVAVVHHRRSIARRAAVSLTVGFAVAIALTALAALVWRALGWVDAGVLDAERPQTGFITAPDHWSVVVAVLAGVAGVLSLTSAKSGALVGVFISVTTVPAAADMGLSLALENWGELRSAATQLGINLLGILGAAVVTLAVQRAVWRRVPHIVPRLRTLGTGAP